MKFLLLSMIGVAAGGLITLQSVVNSVMGKRTGMLGSVFLLTIVSVVVVGLLVVLLPKTAELKNAPGFSEWYLYIGGVMGVGILAAPIFLLPRIGATSTLTAIVIGQLSLALLIDHFGMFSSPKIEISLARIAGLAMLIVGAFLMKK